MTKLTDAEIEARIAAWHDGAASEQSLPEYLGMTDAEYTEWVTGTTPMTAADLCDWEFCGGQSDNPDLAKLNGRQFGYFDCPNCTYQTPAERVVEAAREFGRTYTVSAADALCEEVRKFDALIAHEKPKKE